MKHGIAKMEMDVAGQLCDLAGLPRNSVSLQWFGVGMHHDIAGRHRGVANLQWDVGNPQWDVARRQQGNQADNLCSTVCPEFETYTQPGAHKTLRIKDVCFFLAASIY